MNQRKMQYYTQRTKTEFIYHHIKRWYICGVALEF